MTDLRTLDLFRDAGPASPEPLAPGAWRLPGFAAVDAGDVLALAEAVACEAPWRHMETPGGQRMSVAMTNCGRAGWVSDRLGYRYATADPVTGRPWPAMPGAFRQLATAAAAACGYPDFEPDACLINRYAPGARLTLHQDRNERDLSAPIVSVSLGLPAVFLFGGSQRSERPRRIALAPGDVLVWGGPSRLVYHGVLPVAAGDTAACRINLTFRRALD